MKTGVLSQPDKVATDASEMTQKVIAANQRYFDAVAETYDADPAQKYGCYHPNSRTRYRSFIRKNLVIARRGLTVNLGCGTGNMMEVETEFGLNAIGIDISWAMLERARRVSLRLIQGEVHRLPLPDASVSLASCFLLLHHVYDHELFFREVVRVLQPGGILFSDYDPNYYPSAMTKDHWLLSPIWKCRRAVSYQIMGVGHGNVDVETARMADYYSEVVPGLKREAIAEALRRTGFQQVHVVEHSDATDLAMPTKGRFVHKVFETALWVLGERDYRKRAKIFAVVAQKPGADPPLTLV